MSDILCSESNTVRTKENILSESVAGNSKSVDDDVGLAKFSSYPSMEDHRYVISSPCGSSESEPSNVAIKLHPLLNTWSSPASALVHMLDAMKTLIVSKASQESESS